MAISLNKLFGPKEKDTEQTVLAFFKREPKAYTLTELWTAEGQARDTTQLIKAIDSLVAKKALACKDGHYYWTGFQEEKEQKEFIAPEIEPIADGWCATQTNRGVLASLPPHKRRPQKDDKERREKVFAYARAQKSPVTIHEALRATGQSVGWRSAIVKWLSKNDPYGLRIYKNQRGLALCSSSITPQNRKSYIYRVMIRAKDGTLYVKSAAQTTYHQFVRDRAKDLHAQGADPLSLLSTAGKEFAQKKKFDVNAYRRKEARKLVSMGMREGPAFARANLAAETLAAKNRITPATDGTLKSIVSRFDNFAHKDAIEKILMNLAYFGEVDFTAFQKDYPGNPEEYKWSQFLAHVMTHVEDIERALGVPRGSIKNENFRLTCSHRVVQTNPDASVTA